MNLHSFNGKFGTNLHPRQTASKTLRKSKARVKKRLSPLTGFLGILREGGTSMFDVVAQGEGPLFMDPDADKAREFFRHKNRALVSKVMTVKEAVEKFVHDGEYLAIGGFGANRIPTAVCHEILRQRKKEHDFCRPYFHPRFPDPGGRRGFRPLRYRLHHRAGGPRPFPERPPVHGERKGEELRMDQLFDGPAAEGRGHGRFVSAGTKRHGDGYVQVQRHQSGQVPVHRAELLPFSRPSGPMSPPSTFTRRTSTATAG